MTALLEANALSRTYRRGAEVVQAVDGVSFRLDRHDLVALSGPSGSGKTTLMNLVAGWERPDAGGLSWRGSPVDDLASLPWSEVAVLPQRLGLLEELTVRENVGLPVRLGGGEAARVDQLLEELGLAALADRMPWEISLGEQQRTALARALVLGPDLLLADEPTGHQDAVWATRVATALEVAARTGTACLVATHDPELLPRLPRVLELHDGRLVADRTPPGNVQSS